MMVCMAKNCGSVTELLTDHAWSKTSIQLLSGVAIFGGRAASIKLEVVRYLLQMTVFMDSNCGRVTVLNLAP